MADQDATANEAAGAAVQRAVSKASANYHNSTWDLVDAVRENKVDPAKLEAKDLPEPLRNLKADELKARIEQASKQRAAIQSQIATLNKEREAFVAEELKKQAGAGAKTLDEVMAETTRSQASALGYTFGK